MTMPPYKVVVVEDEKLIRTNIIEKIQLGNPRFVVVGAASDGAQALALMAAQPVDVLFTDIRMPVMDGLALAQAVRAQYPGVQVVIVSGYADFAYAQRAIHLGVEEYLLKPVKRDLLVEVLGKIDAKFSQVARQVELALVRDAINGSLRGQRAVSAQEYVLFLLNIGNLCSVTASNATRRTYDELWGRFDFAALQAQHPGLMVVNAPQPNARFIVLPVTGECDRAAVAAIFFQAFARQASGINVNLLYGAPSRLEGLYAQAGALGLALAQNLVMAESSMSALELATRKPPAAMMPASVYGKLATLIGQGQTEAIQLEVKAMIDAALAQRQCQMWIQDYIHQLIELFQRYSVAISQVEVYHAEYELFDGMSLPGSSGVLFARIWSLLCPMLRDVPKATTASQELIDSICNYLTANFSSAITLEEIARHYNFTPSYLIKVFRRHVGESPIQYLIHLRMEEARRLLRATPDLEIRQIGEIVGYADPHYFSRIFRNVNGVTPTEYRNSAVDTVQAGRARR